MAYICPFRDLSAIARTNPKVEFVRVVAVRVLLPLRVCAFTRTRENATISQTTNEMFNQSTSLMIFLAVIRLDDTKIFYRVFVIPPIFRRNELCIAGYLFYFLLTDYE